MGEGSKELCRKDCNTSIENIILVHLHVCPHVRYFCDVFVYCIIIV